MSHIHLVTELPDCLSPVLRHRQELDLSSNSLGPSTCLILGDALSNSKSLRVLLLNGNPLTHEGGMHLIRGSLGGGCVVERLGLQAASFTKDTWDGGQGAMLFDFEEPQGNYVLDLSEPDERQVCAFFLSSQSRHYSERCCTCLAGIP